MTGEQRMICRIAAAGDYRPTALRRFNELVTVRRSWSLWFLARSVGVLTSTKTFTLRSYGPLFR